MKKRIIKFYQTLIRWYLKPLEFSNKIALFSKGAILQNKEIHILSLADHVKRFNTLKPDDVILDLGVYTGYTLELFSKLFNKIKVIGFEPHPDHFQIASFRIRKSSQIHLENLAIGDRNGNMKFNISTVSSSSSLLDFESEASFRMADKIEITVTTLDDYCQKFKSILCIKLDIEGYEMKALLAGENTLTKTKYVVTEMNNRSVHSGACQYYELDEFLRKHGFKLLALHSDYNYEGVDFFNATYYNTQLVRIQ